jgi:hypothetical protein
VQRVILIVTKIFIKVILSQNSNTTSFSYKTRSRDQVRILQQEKNNSFPNISYKKKEGFQIKTDVAAANIKKQSNA